MQRRSYKLLKILDGYGITPKFGAEVGVQFGKNAYNMLKAFPELTLFLVDNYDTNRQIHVNYKTEEVKEMAFQKLGIFGDHRTLWILKPSVEAAEEIIDGSLDFVFIDAEHTYDAVKEDIIAWKSKVRKRGLLAGHDFSPRFRGVKRAVKEMLGESVNNIGDVWYIQI